MFLAAQGTFHFLFYERPKWGRVPLIPMEEMVPYGSQSVAKEDRPVMLGIWVEEDGFLGCLGGGGGDYGILVATLGASMASVGACTNLGSARGSGIFYRVRVCMGVRYRH